MANLIVKNNKNNKKNSDVKKGFSLPFFRKKTPQGLKERLMEYKPLSRKEIERRKKEREKQEKKLQARDRLKYYLGRAGLEVHGEFVSRQLFRLAIAVNILVSAYLIWRFATDLKVGITPLLFAIAIVWFVVFGIVLFLLWLILYLTLDLRIFKRRLDIEQVLPDFLQLTSANIRAGMPIDRALWYAVRPRFGVLAKEIESVAKETMSGTDLSQALTDFTNKYDSKLLKRSINLLVEGIEAGGEVGELLDKIASNVLENQTLRREMAANVMTYVIFITAATLLAAPFLFALSGQLLKVIISITASIAPVETTATPLASFGLSFREIGIKPSDFMIFSVISLLTTSFFSSLIIATIRKGEVRSGIRNIPVFIIITLSLYFIGSLLFDKLLTGLF